jgi:PAS domain-containing protein
MTQTDENTKQKQASQYARSLIEASLDPLVTISAEGKITDVNGASVKVTGIPREKLMGTAYSNYFTDPKKHRKVISRFFVDWFSKFYLLHVFIYGRIIVKPSTFVGYTRK